MTFPNRWNSLPSTVAAILAISTIALVGSLLDRYLGAPKSFFLIVTAMVIWSTCGWLLGGWRPVLGGLATLAAALTASEGTFPLVLIFACTAFLILFADVSPRDDEHSKSLTSN
jgi:hypothetical protein